MSVLLKTSNGRLRIDPQAITAVETIRPKLKEESEQPDYGRILIEDGVKLYGSVEEVTEIAEQWEEYLEHGPGDDDDDDQKDDEDEDQIDVPETIDLTPQPISIVPRRRRQQS